MAEKSNNNILAPNELRYMNDVKPPIKILNIVKMGIMVFVRL